MLRGEIDVYYPGFERMYPQMCELRSPDNFMKGNSALTRKTSISMITLELVPGFFVSKKDIVKGRDYFYEIQVRFRF